MRAADFSSSGNWGVPRLTTLALATLAGAEEPTSIPSRLLGLRDDRTAPKWLARYQPGEQDFVSSLRALLPRPGAGLGLG